MQLLLLQKYFVISLPHHFTCKVLCNRGSVTLAHLQQPKIRLSEICCQGVMSATSTCPKLRPKTTTSLAPCLQTDPLVMQVQIQPKRKPQMNWTLNYQGSWPRSPELAHLSEWFHSLKKVQFMGLQEVIQSNDVKMMGK